MIAAYHRERADRGEVQALVDMGDLLYWDRPEQDLLYEPTVRLGDGLVPVSDLRADRSTQRNPEAESANPRRAPITTDVFARFRLVV